MLDFHNKTQCQGLLPTNMLTYLVNIYCFGACYIIGWYSDHCISDLLMYYSTTKWSNFPTLMIP